MEKISNPEQAEMEKLVTEIKKNMLGMERESRKRLGTQILELIKVNSTLILFFIFYLFLL